VSSITKTADQMNELMFCCGMAEDLGYFAITKRAEYVNQIHQAISNANNWGEFRNSLPDGEFESLYLWEYQVYFDGVRHLCLDKDLLNNALSGDANSEIIRFDQSFSAEQLPGHGDGDYPPFLLPEQDNFLPTEFCNKYGERANSMVSGSWWEFPINRIEEMKQNLESAGFSVSVENSDWESADHG
jgi:hypothetical protein